MKPLNSNYTIAFICMLCIVNHVCAMQEAQRAPLSNTFANNIAKIEEDFAKCVQLCGIVRQPPYNNYADVLKTVEEKRSNCVTSCEMKKSDSFEDAYSKAKRESRRATLTPADYAKYVARNWFRGDGNDFGSGGDLFE